MTNAAALIVAAMFSAAAPRRAYARLPRGLDPAAAAALGGLGALFAIDGARAALR